MNMGSVLSGAASSRLSGAGTSRMSGAGPSRMSGDMSYNSSQLHSSMLEGLMDGGDQTQLKMAINMVAATKLKH